MQAAAYGFGLERQHLGGFLDAHFLDHPEDEDEAGILPAGCRSPLPRVSGSVAAPLVISGLSMGEPGGKIDDAALHPPPYRRRLPACGASCEARPSASFMTMRVQPGGKGAGALEIGQVPECLEIGILQRVFRHRIVAQDAAGNAEEPPVIAPHDGAETPDIVRQCQRHQLGVASIRQRYLCLQTSWLILFPHWMPGQAKGSRHHGKIFRERQPDTGIQSCVGNI